MNEALEACTAAIVQNTIETILMSKATTKEITNHIHGLDIVTCSLAHLKYLMFKYFKSNIKLLNNPKLEVHMANLCILAGLQFL